MTRGYSDKENQKKTQEMFSSHEREREAERVPKLFLHDRGFCVSVIQPRANVKLLEERERERERE